ncbi:hypothetical protein BDA96_02G250900 [Sorghum bicolor]|uniref:Uncharacterized protein n=1 Tax=Sorghum bicolor TaxID=4558 RepID=A0A921RQ86_SORBI|nr:hypothetical protein BDA96_02G250900 [Sorghum bicolor]
MLGNIQVMSVLGWRLCKLHDNGKMTSGRHLSVDCADLDHKTGAGDGGARQGAPRRQWHRHQFPCWQGVLRHGVGVLVRGQLPCQHPHCCEGDHWHLRH